MKVLFTKDATRAAFENWIGSPETLIQNQHICDDHRFYEFVRTFYENEDSGYIEEDAFVHKAMSIDFRAEAEEVYSKYCDRANAILAYLRYFRKKIDINNK